MPYSDVRHLQSKLGAGIGPSLPVPHGRTLDQGGIQSGGAGMSFPELKVMVEGVVGVAQLAGPGVFSVHPGKLCRLPLDCHCNSGVK